MTDALPALTASDISLPAEENLRALRSSREAFIRADSCDKVKRALSHNIRTDVECEYNKPKTKWSPDMHNQI